MAPRTGTEPIAADPDWPEIDSESSAARERFDTLLLGCRRIALASSRAEVITEVRSSLCALIRADGFAVLQGPMRAEALSQKLAPIAPERLALWIEETANSGDGGVFEEPGKGTGLLIPIRVHRSVEMGLFAWRKSFAARFQSSDERIARTLAELAGATLENLASDAMLRARSGELREAVEQLRDAREQMAKADQLAALGSVGAALVHELSAPVDKIRKAVQRVDRSEALLTPGAREELSVIRAAVARMEKVVENVTRVARGSPQRMVRFDPADSVDDAAQLLRRQLASRGITLEWIRRDDPDRMVMGDPGRLQQLVINLLVNARDELDALGEGHPRRISSLCERVGSRVLLVVEDSGRGVPEQIVDRLFDPFVTARSAGLGLGLSISQEIASEHGATLRLARGGSPGARFELSIPVAK